MVRKLLGQGADVQAATVQGWSPLHVACKYSVTSCPSLLERHAWVMQHNKDGFTPLHYLCRQPWSLGLQEVCVSMLAAGAEVDAAAFCGNTPLAEALGAGNVHCARFLLSKQDAKVVAKVREKR
jgi:ankyrin repeat protein